jgi:GntR family transcriptional regulator
MTLQYQLKAKLTERISRGDWKPGSKIMSEREICEEYGVSRMTVREVVGGLEREGLLIRKQGKGTFVGTAKPEPEQTHVYKFMDTIHALGLRVTTRVLDYQIIPCKLQEARELEIAVGERIYRIERLRSVDGALFSVEVSYIPISVAPGMTEASVKESGLTAALKQHSGLEPDSATETIEAVSCPDKPSMMIGIKRDSPVLRVCRISKAGEKTVEFCESIIKGDRFKYIVEFR